MVDTIFPKPGPNLQMGSPAAYFKAKYQGLVVRRGHKKAIVALAHKLIRTIYFMLTRRQAYHDSGIDYAAANVAKNAPCWLKALKRFGYWPETAAA